jgi:hypothetical protein
MHCPHCNSRQVFQSRRGNALLRWPFRLFLLSVRCYKCQSRFFRLKPYLGGREVRKPPSQVSFY